MWEHRSGLRGIAAAVFLAFFLWAPLPGGAQQPIQRQETDWDGIQVELTQVKRDGDVLNVQFILRNVGESKATVQIKFADAYILDMVNKKKLTPYEGPDKVVFAGPLYDKSFQGRFVATIDPKKRKVAWIKFPAPPAGVKKVSLVLPGVLPFEGVSIAE